MEGLLILGAIGLLAVSLKKKKGNGGGSLEIEGRYRDLRYRCYWSRPPLPPIILPNGSIMPQQESNMNNWRGFFETEGGGHYGAYGKSGPECEAMVKSMIDAHLGG